MSKRKRDRIFVPSEKMALIDLVEKYFAVVESKKTDAKSITNKIHKWHIIAQEFNENSNIHPRNWTVLKNCWDNLKKRAKHEYTWRNQHFLRTGELPKKIEDLATARVLVLIQLSVAGLINPFDSDGTRVLDPARILPSHDPASEHLLCTVDTYVDESQETETTETTICCTPRMLSEESNPALSRSPSPPEMKYSVDQSSPVITQVITQEPQQSPNTQQAPVMNTDGSPRRQLVRRRQTQNLFVKRKKMLLMTNLHAQEEHAVKMNIMRLQAERHKVILAQENLKTLREKEILEQEKYKTLQEKIKLEILQSQLQK